MTKADLVELLYGQGTISTKGEAVDTIECLLETIKSTLEEGEEVKIAGFGKFEICSKRARRGRNPQTGEELTIGERNVLLFRPSKILKDMINA